MFRSYAVGRVHTIETGPTLGSRWLLGAGSEVQFRTVRYVLCGLRLIPSHDQRQGLLWDDD